MMNIAITFCIILLTVGTYTLSNNRYERLKFFYKTIPNFRDSYQNTKFFFWTNIAIMFLMFCIDTFSLFVLISIWW